MLGDEPHELVGQHHGAGGTRALRRLEGRQPAGLEGGQPAIDRPFADPPELAVEREPAASGGDAHRLELLLTAPHRRGHVRHDLVAEDRLG